jgi:hypothetical protein
MHSQFVRLGTADEALAVQLLSHDVEATVGPAQLDAVRQQAAVRREFANSVELADTMNSAEYVDNVAEKVQQYFHDCHVDTTWPECPFHRRHPLWLHDGYWTCEELRHPVAQLGSIIASTGPAGRYVIHSRSDRAPAG